MKIVDNGIVATTERIGKMKNNDEKYWTEEKAHSETSQVMGIGLVLSLGIMVLGIFFVIIFYDADSGKFPIFEAHKNVLTECPQAPNNKDHYVQ